MDALTPLPDRATVGCSSPRAADPESRVRVGRWEQSEGSLDPQEQRDAFPYPGWIPPRTPLCQVELVALMAASESCATVAADAVPVLGISTLRSG